MAPQVRKRGRSSVFIKCVRHRPKEGLFGLRTWLAEPWLEAWLTKEGIQLGDDPSFAEPSSPPVKRHKGARSPSAGCRLGRVSRVSRGAAWRGDAPPWMAPW
jgi:hypothetical protein